MAIRLKGAAPKAGTTDRRYYLIDVQEGYRRVRLSTGTRDKTLALRKEQQVIDALREDINVSDEALRELVRGEARTLAAAQAKAKATGLTLRAAFDDALADRGFWRDRRSHADIATNCRIVCDHLGGSTPLNSIDQAAVDRLVDSLEAVGYAPSTVNRKMHSLMALLRRESDRGRYTGKLPRYKPTSERARRRKFVLSVDDEALIMERVLLWDELPEASGGGRPRKRDARDYHDLFVFLADVGCRLSQAFILPWSAIVERGDRMAIRFWDTETLKGGDERTVPCTARVAEVLRRGREALQENHPGPFSMLEKTRASKLWRFAIKGTHLAKEKDCVIHALRHTCASRLLEETGNLKLVQEWLGHADIATTAAIYTKVMPKQRMVGVEALERFAPPAPPAPR